MRALLLVALPLVASTDESPGGSGKPTEVHALLKQVRAERDQLRTELYDFREKYRALQAELKNCRAGAAATTTEDASLQFASKVDNTPMTTPSASHNDVVENYTENDFETAASSSGSTAAPAPPPRHRHPPRHPPLPAPAPPGAPPLQQSASDLAQIEKHGSPCPIEWGSRRDGTRLRSIGETTLSGCCILCRGVNSCNAFNYDANQGAGRCYLLAGSVNAREVKDAGQKAVYSSAPRRDGCSCARIGAFAAGRESLAFAKGGT